MFLPVSITKCRRNVATPSGTALDARRATRRLHSTTSLSSDLAGQFEATRSQRPATEKQHC
jgi:hypothetical protein